MKSVRAAFTLVELLVVVAIIGILAALMLPALSKSSERARVTVCRSNLSQLGVALRMYLDEHGNRFPTMHNRVRGTNDAGLRTPEVVLKPQLGISRVWQCPSDRVRLFEETGSSYFWNNLLNGQPSDQVSLLGLPMKDSRFPLFSDKTGFHSAMGTGRMQNHLYADGQVKDFFLLEPNQ